MSEEVGIYRASPAEQPAIIYYNSNGMRCEEQDAWAYMCNNNYYIVTHAGEPKQKQVLDTLVKRENVYKRVSSEIMNMYLGYLATPSPVNYEAVKSRFQLGGYN